MMTPDQFETKYIPEPNSGCWLWIAAASDRGYGLFRHQKHTIWAHRHAWALHRGEIPPGLCVLHKCDTPACVNPDHLFLGTRADNQADKMRKGRNRGGFGDDRECAGTKHPLAKLTEPQVLAIRSDTRSHSTIGREYGVGQAQVTRIKNRTRWAHL
jgi:hypothetical protein